jgi:hypothetical protein
MKKGCFFGFLCVCFLLSLMGCGKKDEKRPSSKAGTPAAEMPAQPVEETPEQKQARLQKKFDEFKSYADRNPDDISGVTARYNELKKEAGGTPLEVHIDRVMTNSKTAFERNAKEAYESLVERINTAREKYKSEQLLPSDMAEKYAKLASDIESYPSAYRTTKWWEELQNIKKDIAAEADAAKVWAESKADATREGDAGRYKEAIAKLETFPQEFRSSVWEKERQELLKTYQEALARREETVKQEEKLEWKDLFSGEPIENTVFNIKETDTDRWTVKDKILVCDNTAGTDDAWLCTPKETKWKNFVLEMEFRFTNNGSLTICVHGSPQPDKPDYFGFDKKTITFADFGPNVWHTAKIRVRNKKIIIESTSLVAPLEGHCDREDGVFGLVANVGTKIEIRKIRMALYPEK